jgi:pimeloyl-ACP methyl ester carboxylesterase
VDPNRVYLGGHSTGAVLALLAVESSTRFRTVFAFGPVADPRQYGPNNCIPPEARDLDAESRPRAPIQWLYQIATPTLIIDGEQGNAAVFPSMQKRSGRAPIRYVTIPGATHFNGLAPGCELVAKAILADTGAKPAFDSITGDAIHAAMATP